jgi:hypothetical protein
MTRFNLTSIDWGSVSLLHGAHLSGETAYLEEMMRWTLYHSFPMGIIYLGEGDLLVSSSSVDYEITLKLCKAITPKGYIVEIDDTNRPIQLRGNNTQHSEIIVPIYLEVHPKQSVPFIPAQSAALAECCGLQRNYILTTNPSSSALDYLQIGQMRKEGTRFVADTYYIPECVYLNSHPILIDKAQRIISIVQESLDILRRYAGTEFGFSHLAAASMAAALASAAIVSDWKISPRAWIQRLLEVLVAMRHLIQPLASQRLSTWVPAKDQLEDALNYVQQHYGNPSPLWETLDRVEKALTALQPLYRELREPIQPHEKPAAAPIGHIPVAPASGPGTPVPRQGSEPSIKIRRCQCGVHYTVRPGETDPGKCPKCLAYPRQ